MAAGYSEKQFIEEHVKELFGESVREHVSYLQMLKAWIIPRPSNSATLAEVAKYSFLMQARRQHLEQLTKSLKMPPLLARALQDYANEKANPEDVQKVLDGTIEGYILAAEKQGIKLYQKEK